VARPARRRASGSRSRSGAERGQKRASACGTSANRLSCRSRQARTLGGSCSARSRATRRRRAGTTAASAGRRRSAAVSLLLAKCCGVHPGPARADQAAHRPLDLQQASASCTAHVVSGGPSGGRGPPRLQGVLRRNGAAVRERHGVELTPRSRGVQGRAVPRCEKSLEPTTSVIPRAASAFPRRRARARPRIPP
jgi:hypothetical protein